MDAGKLERTRKRVIEMISFDDAYSTILDHCPVMPTEWKSLDESLGYVLASDLSAKDAVPRFDNSAMDGYAVRLADLMHASDSNPVTLEVSATIPAGSFSSVKLRKGQAAHILTGAPIPPGADAVVMKEYCTRKGSSVQVRKSPSKGQHIRRRAEEFDRGKVIIQAASMVTPPLAGLIATLGYARVRVYRKPNVTLIVTGEELQSPGSRLKQGQIWESNSFALSAALKLIGITATIVRIGDSKAATTKAVAKALQNSDVVISSGGISVGEFDYLRAAFESNNVQEHFWKVAQKPGKPVYFGTKGKKLIIGLPGNPVSGLLSLYTLVRPALMRMMGSNVTDPRRFRVKIKEPLTKKAGRTEFVRMQIEDMNGRYEAVPARGQESHMLGGLAFSNALYRFPENATRVKAGSNIDVELLQWSVI
jgi:molybdopterin molybdotransferase